LLRYKEIFLGNQCNNRCIYCLYRRKDLSHIGIDSIIAEINDPYIPPFTKGGQEGGERDTETTPKKEDGIAFYGGEPTLRGDLLNIIQAANRNGYRRIKLITNGRLLSGIHFLQQLINSGCCLFEIKVWGSNPGIHDYITQTKGSFIETLRGLENLIRFPTEKFICVRIPLCKQNYSDVENTVAMVLGFGINRIILSFSDYDLSFKEAMPHIKNAINISIFNRIWILTEGLPFCVMQGLEPHISEIYTWWNTIDRRLFQHHTYCIDCIFRELCSGIEKGYLQKFGEKEYPPVKESRYIKDIKALYE
jgi:cyclic pyranopterin phosphate synthase